MKSVVLARVALVSLSAMMTACVAQRDNAPATAAPRSCAAAGSRPFTASSDASPPCADGPQTALLYCTATPQLGALCQTWRDIMTDHAVTVTEASCATSFRALYLANTYTFVIAVTNDAQQVSFWKGDVPSSAQFRANWLEPDGRVATFIRIVRTDSGQATYPVAGETQSLPVGDSWFTNFTTWLKRVLPCVQDCLTNFVTNLPPDLEIEMTIEVTSTPPGIKISVTLKGNSAQAGQVALLTVELTRCYLACL